MKTYSPPDTAVLRTWFGPRMVIREPKSERKTLCLGFLGSNWARVPGPTKPMMSSSSELSHFEESETV